MVLLSGPTRVAAKGRLSCNEAAFWTLRQARKLLLICSSKGSVGRFGNTVSDMMIAEVKTWICCVLCARNWSRKGFAEYVAGDLH